MPLSRTNHAVEDSDQGGTFGLSARLVCLSSDRFELIHAEQVCDVVSDVLPRWVLVVVEVERVYKVAREASRDTDATAFGVELESVTHRPVSEGAHTVLSVAHRVGDRARQLL